MIWAMLMPLTQAIRPQALDDRTDDPNASDVSDAFESATESATDSEPSDPESVSLFDMPAQGQSALPLASRGNRTDWLDRARAICRVPAHQPVNWLEYDEHALALASELNRPILLDVGAGLVPLVPCDGPRVLRERNDRGLYQR